MATVTLTNEQIFGAIALLSQAGSETGKLGYAIAKNKRKLASEIKEYAEKRDGLVRKYGTESENGMYTLPVSTLDDFKAELSEYADIECEVNVMQVDEDTFCSGSLTAVQMEALDWMVMDE